MSYNDELQSNNEELLEILNTVNEMPEAGSGPSVDLTGYATEQWVRDGYQPKGNYALKSDIPEPPVRSVNGKTGAVTLSASDVGALPAGTKIPTKTSDLANDSGFVKGSFMVSIIESDDGLSADKTPMEIASAFIDGRYVYANYGGIQLGLAAANEDVAIFFLNGGNSIGHFTVLPDKTVSMESFMVATEDMIPTNTSELTNDSGFITGYTESDPTVPAWAKAASKPSYSKSEVGLGNVDNVKQYSASNPPPYPVTSVNGKTGAVTLDTDVTADKVKNALGYTPMNSSEYAVSVKALGAKGEGSTNDTAVFQTALANNRRVYVPGGTYKLSGELVIRDNCQLELAQDVVLNFTQTSGNCITVNRSSWLKGNHATIFVPYAFTGKVINADTTVHTNAKDVTPWVHWDPQWKTARYITDINICKFDGNGIHQSKTGDTNGTAVYISATGGGASTFMWGVNLSGLRIAGAFEYGIRAQNFNSGWNHEMRLEAFIDACKIGLSLEDCNKVYFAGSIQPRKAANGTVYAKHGIQLIRSNDTELSGSRVWDWNDANSLWTFDKSNVNQHIAMYGNCCGTILNDYLYHNLPSGFSDIRELIYTDTSANFDSLIIVQEPFTKWFKPVNGEPHFDNGDGSERLVLKKEQDALFQTDYVPQFKDELATASNGSGAVFNEIGYQRGYALLVNGTLASNAWTACTGFIPCKNGDTIYVSGMSFNNTSSGEARIILFDSTFAKIMHVNRDNIVANGSYYYLDEYTETETGFSIKIKNATTAFIRLSVPLNTLSTNPVISVGEPISYTQEGFLSDGIRVKEPNIIGMEKYERTGRMVTTISSASTDAQYPTAKAVYALLSNAMGAYVDAVDALIGGGG